jgi:hypothetical protein
MEKIWFYYYSFLLMVLIVALTYYFLLWVSNDPYSTEHFISVNLTKINDTCRIIWLGGWDFDSFYTNVTVNGVNMGHPRPFTVIYNDTCQDIVVKMHDKSIHYDVELYRYNHTGEQ